jgi:hypothetical protein
MAVHLQKEKEARKIRALKARRMPKSYEIADENALIGGQWCCERDSNSRPLPYQGSALPLSYHSSPSVGVLAIRAASARVFCTLRAYSPSSAPIERRVVTNV